MINCKALIGKESTIPKYDPQVLKEIDLVINEMEMYGLKNTVYCKYPPSLPSLNNYINFIFNILDGESIKLRIRLQLGFRKTNYKQSIKLLEEIIKLE